MASLSIFFALLLSLPLLSSLAEAQTPPLVNGLSYTFYNTSCPNLETVIRNQLRTAFQTDIGLAAALLRIHFHDCFVQGCDGSVLNGLAEQQAPPNLTLRPAGLRLISALRDAVERSCGRVVSCSDITAVAARDSVFLSGGPDYRVPLGRRDSLTFATQNETLANLPGPSFNATALMAALAAKNLTATDLVALSGGHTIGIGHCTSFTDRLYPTRDPTMDQTFARNLRITCPTNTTDNTTVLDIRSPNAFDNRYYVDLMNRQTLFTSDQDLYTNSITRPIVTSYAINQSLFFEQFAISMVKMGQLGVLTGNQGEIRANCSRRNSGNDGFLSTVVDGGDEQAVY